MPRPFGQSLAAATLSLALLVAVLLSARGAELVHVDDAGVIRWNDGGAEVALFGANYCLPSACDYRAAGYVGANRKKLVEQDLLHFARMGWDAMRLCLWGDWENSDAQGNLIENDHLALMDYAIAQAKKRGIYILLTPITTYGAWWPDGKATDEYPGFAKHFEKSQLGTDPAAIAVQVNYLRQMMEHVNPFTGVALKDEPQILFVEMINEPSHHPEDFTGSVAYINALVDAVRRTGCQKILFHNLSQDMRMTAAIKASQAQGVTFAWYPTGLNHGHELTDNHLRSVDNYPPMLRPDLYDVPKIVYEFDSPDMNSGYMYPAMVRAFRGVGAQFATMFSYDMLATAPYNLGWQTHFLNLIYSPKKAVSAVIAAEAMRRLPRYAHYGDYPANTRFGSFRVSYEEDSSELVTNEVFMHANATATPAPAPGELRRIVGVGNSPVVAYEGNGAYFLDKLSDGLWRLEVYPDAVPVQDPFAQQLNYQTVSSRLVWRTWPMTVHLPDLGATFALLPLNEGNTLSTRARDHRVGVNPGVYLLSRDPDVDRTKLPSHVGPIGLAEFVCPAPPLLPAQILPAVQETYPAGEMATIAVDVVDPATPRAVTLHWRAAGQPGFRTAAMARQHGYRYAVTLPGPGLPEATYQYFVTVETPAVTIRHPAEEGSVLAFQAVSATTPLPLFDASRDIPALVYTRIGDNVRHGIFRSLPATATAPAALQLTFPVNLDSALDDYTASLAVKDRVRDRRAAGAKPGEPAAAVLTGAKALRIRARGTGDGQPFFVTLVEADGTAWSTRLAVSSSWQDIDVPISALGLAQGVKLPLGYPERWNYWTTPAAGRGAPGDAPRLGQVERVQMSFRSSGGKPSADSAASVDVASIALVFD